MTEEGPPLLHISQNEHCPETIVFIHGNGGYYREWEAVAAHISSYHILMPSMSLVEDSPTSTDIRRMNLEKASVLLANLIRNHAKDGKAHVVGLNLGAAMAVYLAGHIPEVVRTLFVSGFPRFGFPQPLLPALSYITCGLNAVGRSAPQPLASKLNSGIEFDLRGPNTNTVDSQRDVIEMISSKNQVSPILARTLIVVAGKRGILPTDDSVPKNKQLLTEVTSPPGNQESKAVLAPNMRHAWHLQDQKLFADCVVAWIERKSLPSELKDL